MSANKSAKSGHLPCGKLIAEREKAATEIRECKTVGYTPVHCVLNRKPLEEAVPMKPVDLTPADYATLRQSGITKQGIKRLYGFTNDAAFYARLKALGVYPETDKVEPPKPVSTPILPTLPDTLPTPPISADIWFTGRTDTEKFIVVSTGKISFGANISNELAADFVQFGLTSNNHLKIRISDHNGYPFHKKMNGSNRKSACCAELTSELKMRGIEMPVTFLMQYHANENEWEGEIKHAK